MIKIDVRHNIREQAASLAKLSRDMQGKAVAMALNKTVAKGKTEMTRAITSEFNIKAGEVRPQLNVRRASARGANLVALLQAFASRRKGRSLNLIHFLAKQKKSASELGFKIKKRGGVKQIRGAFVGNKGRTVFIREPGTTMPTRSKYAGTKHAEAVKALSTIDVPQMFNTRRVNERVVRRIEKEFPVEFARAVRLLLDRR